MTAGYTGAEIYRRLVEQKVGTEGLHQSTDQVSRLMQRFTELSDRIENAAGKLEGSWTGPSAGAAQRGAGPASAMFSRMAESLDKARKMTRAQAEVTDEVSGKLVPVPAIPAQPSGLTKLDALLPGHSGPADYGAAMQAKQGAEAHNVHQYRSLAAATGQHIDNLPRTHPAHGEDTAGSEHPMRVQAAQGSASGRTDTSAYTSQAGADPGTGAGGAAGSGSATSPYGGIAPGYVPGGRRGRDTGDRSAGRGRKADREKTTPDFLVTRGHGNEVVGDIPPTAPPVIGQDTEPRHDTNDEG
ncbi:hypothetical protein [Sciscionella sediminilitoris]|uniref:hypothetical protein n=1 Tax=Sciscionella sediminilitoris TaxID=1445613 RepID=UPI0004DED143|nr:hypothetical protein [Sciscionella sp. SE31]